MKSWISSDIFLSNRKVSGSPEECEAFFQYDIARYFVKKGSAPDVMQACSLFFDKSEIYIFHE
jgi:hypothetical protein